MYLSGAKIRILGMKGRFNILSFTFFPITYNNFEGMKYLVKIPKVLWSIFGSDYMEVEILIEEDKGSAVPSVRPVSVVTEFPKAEIDKHEVEAVTDIQEGQGGQCNLTDPICANAWWSRVWGFPCCPTTSAGRG